MDSDRLQVLIGDSRNTLKQLSSESVQTVVTSPPYYGLRDYGEPGQIGLEETPEKYVQNLVDVFREVRRVLRDDGTVWLNLGDSYAGGGGYAPNAPSNQNGGSLSAKQGGSTGAKPKGIKTPDGLKPKDLIGIPWRVAFALQADGWYLRQDIIWHKPNPMPESVTDRCTKSHEYLFLLSKSARYFYDAEAVKEESTYNGTVTFGGPAKLSRCVNGQKPSGNEKTTDRRENYASRNRRSVWTIATQPYSGAHFATFPPKLIEPCILAGSREGDTVLDPFGGSGTTAGVALEHGRKAILCEMSPKYAKLIPGRIDAITDALRQEMLPLD